MEKPQFTIKKIGVSSAYVLTKPGGLQGGNVSKSVGIILIILLIVSILLGAVRRRQLLVMKNETEIRVQVEHQLDEAQAIFLLNPARSRELIVSARSALSNLDSKDLGNIKDLIRRVEDAEHQILGDYKKDPQVFFDLTLFSDDFSGSELFITGNNLYIFDKNANKVVSVNAGSKRSEIVAGPSLLKDADLIIPFSSKVLYLNKTGVYEMNGKRLLDQSFEHKVVASQFGGNLYVLDLIDSQVYRYAGNSDTFLTGSLWLKEGENVDLSKAKLLAIDGFLWVLSDDGRITKLSQGRKVGFNVKGFDMEGFYVSTMFTDGESKYLYLLDAGTGKMLVLEKEGKYKALYTSENLRGISSLAVYEENKKAFLLKSNKLLYLDLDHL